MDEAQWVKVEFYGRVPDLQIITGVEPAEVCETLMRAFGFTHIDGLSVCVAPRQDSLAPPSPR